MTDRSEVEVGGRRMQILVDGDTGPVVLLCSGLGGRALHWHDAVLDLAADHTVVRFDRPGAPVHSSSPGGERLQVREEADRIAAVLDAVRPSDTAVLVGHSVGGFYAEAFARLYPRRTRALLLLDSSIARPRRLGLPLRLKLRAARTAIELLTKLQLTTPLTRAGLELLQRRRPSGLDGPMRSEIRRVAADPGFADALLTEYLGYRELAGEMYSLRAHRPLPPVPRLVATAHTGLRTRCWRAQQLRLANDLDAQHVTVSRTGHHVMIERPRRTADLIRLIAEPVHHDPAAVLPD